jgi:GT2 family glycosyltransferase
MGRPTVSVVIPTLNEECHLARTLDAVAAQTYADVIEILVADGRSTDRTRQIATRRQGVRVIDNPERIQAAGLNHALAAARGEIVVRVDGHCVIAPDYVERCVAALEATGAAMVGGGMHPAPEAGSKTRIQRGIAVAMSSRVGGGPARFHVGGSAGWVDTVYLGAFWADTARQIGGYASDLAVNEDAEFAIRMRTQGGIWFDPGIHSTYAPRTSLHELARQFYRYGVGRSVTARRHPTQVKVRQLAAPALVLGLLSGQRRTVALAYAAMVAARAAYEATKDPEVAPAMAVALPVMHVSWGLGFLHGLITSPSRPRAHGAGSEPALNCAPPGADDLPVSPQPLGR